MVMTMAAMSTVVERLIDERLWQSNVIDLKQVMSLAKSVYVLLEHHNEARLRVAVEIVTCPVARKCLWWNDNWYADEAQHKYFKQIVRDKLGMVVTAIRGVFTNLPEEPSTPEGDGVDVGALRKKLEEAEAVARSAQGQQRLLEVQMREAQSQLQEANERIKALEKSLDGMREKARQLTTQAAQQQAELQSVQGGESGQTQNGRGRAGSPEGPAGSLGTSSSAQGGGQIPTSSGTPDDRKRLAELERLIKLGEAERDKLQQRINELQDKLLKSEVAANRAPRQRGAEHLPPEQQAAEEAAAAVQVGKAAVVAQGPDAKKLAELTTLLEAERKKVRDLEEQMRPVKAELGKVQEKFGFSEQRATASEKRVEVLQERVKVLEKDLQNAGKTPTPQEAGKQVAVASAVSDDREEEIAELRRKTKLVEPLQEKVVKRDAEIAALKEELAKLEDLKNRMARTLAQVRDQLRRVTEIAERKGLGKIVAEIMNEAEVTETVNSAEFTCFARLWEDALRRQQKARFIERRRMGVSDDEEEQASPHEKHFLTKRSRQTPTAGSAPHRYGAEWDDHSWGYAQDRTGSSLSLDGTQSAKQEVHWHGTGEAYQAGYDVGYRAGWEGCSNSTDAVMRPTAVAQGTMGRQPTRPNALMLSQSDAVVQDLGIGSSMRIAGLGRGSMSRSAPLLPTGATSPDHASRSYGITTPMSPMDGQPGFRTRLGAESAFDSDHSFRAMTLGTPLGHSMRTPTPLGHVMSRSAKALTRTLSEWPGAGGSGPSGTAHGRPKTHAGLPHSPTSSALGELPFLAVTVPAGTVEALSNHSPTPTGRLRMGAPVASGPGLPVAAAAAVAEEAASRAAARGVVWGRLPAPLGTRRSSSPALSPRTLWRSKRPADLDMPYPNRAADQGGLMTSPPVTGYSLSAKSTVNFAAPAYHTPTGARTPGAAVIPEVVEKA